MIVCGIISSTILSSAFGAVSYCHHLMRVYVCPFSIKPPVKMKYRLFRSIQTKAPNTGFVLSTGLSNNLLISPQFWNYMLDRYAIRNFRVAVLITPMKWSPYLQNYSVAVTDAKYESAQTILSLLAHSITSSFRAFVP